MAWSAAAKSARRGLMRAASCAQDAPRGSVAQWDARTSANDYRAALSIALGKPIASLHPVLGVGPTVRGEAS